MPVHDVLLAALELSVELLRKREEKQHAGGGAASSSSSSSSNAAPTNNLSQQALAEVNKVVATALSTLRSRFRTAMLENNLALTLDPQTKELSVFGAAEEQDEDEDADRDPDAMEVDSEIFEQDRKSPGGTTRTRTPQKDKNLPTFVQDFNKVIRRTLAKTEADPSSTANLIARLKASSSTTSTTLATTNTTQPENDKKAEPIMLNFEDVDDTFEFLKIQHLPTLPQKPGSNWVYPGLPGRVANLNIRHFLEAMRAKNLKEDRNPFDVKEALKHGGKRKDSVENNDDLMLQEDSQNKKGTSSSAGDGLLAVAGTASNKRQRTSSIDASIQEQLGGAGAGASSPHFPGMNEDDLPAEEDDPENKNSWKDQQNKGGSITTINPAEQFQVGKNSSMQFVQYSRKLQLKALPHPSPVSEPLSIANVDLPRVKPSFELRIPYQLFEKGALSSQQLETITYAAMRLDDRRAANKTAAGCARMNAYLLGDGTGCGKGRVISALIIHNWNLGIRRHIWVSATAQLLEDARRDLRDLSATHIPVMSVSDFIDRLQQNNPMISNLPAKLRSKLGTDKKARDDLRDGKRIKFLEELNFDGIEGIVFFTYNKLARDVKNELMPVLQWFTHGEARLHSERKVVDEDMGDGGYMKNAFAEALASVEMSNNAFNSNKRKRHLEELSSGSGSNYRAEKIARNKKQKEEQERQWAHLSPRSRDAAREDAALQELLLDTANLSTAGVTTSSKGKNKTKKELEQEKRDQERQLKQQQLNNQPNGNRTLGILAFDEAHKAKNLQIRTKKDGTVDKSQSSKIGLAVCDWQELYCRNSKVVYASATAATEVNNMGYMSRLGLWGPEKVYKTFQDFSKSISSGGVTAMEVVAINLKAYGVMSCRSLSYCGCEFSQIPMELTEKMQRTYDNCCGLVREMKEEFAYFIDHPVLGQLYKSQMKQAKGGDKKNNKSLSSDEDNDADDLNDERMFDSDYEEELVNENSRRRKNKPKAKAKQGPGSKSNKNEIVLEGRVKSKRDLWREFWSFQQRFYKHLLVCFKIDKTVELIQEALKPENNEQVVVSLWSTGESRIVEHLNNRDEDEIGVRNNNDPNEPEQLLSGPLLALQHALDQFFKTSEQCPESFLKKNALEEKLKSFQDDLPPNALDYLIERCGGHKAVAEISGRSKRMVRDTRTLQIKYEQRTAESNFVVPLNGIGAAQISANMEKYGGVAGQSSTSSASASSSSTALAISSGGSSSSSSSSSGAGAGASSSSRAPVFGGAPLQQPVAAFGSVQFTKEEYNAKVSRAKKKAKAQPKSRQNNNRRGNNNNDDNFLLQELERDLMNQRAGLPLGNTNNDLAVIQAANSCNRAATGSAALNIAEQHHFQSGRKKIALITEAGSTGISLHCEKRPPQDADPKVFQFRKRRMITIELPWGADKAIQQFGRIHRSNQVHQPRFQIVITPVQGEIRFVSSISRRMKLMGAVTKGDRHSTMGGVDECLDGFDINNAYGKKALSCLLDDLRGHPPDDRKEKIYDLMDFYNEDFKKDAFLNLELCDLFRSATGDSKLMAHLHSEELEESNNLNRFLNRLLMLNLDMQDSVFKLFEAIYDHLVQVDKDNDNYNQGKIVQLNRAPLERAFATSSKSLYSDRNYNGAKCNITHIRLDRGIPWDTVWQKYEKEMLPRMERLKKDADDYERDKLQNATDITNRVELFNRQQKLNRLRRKHNYFANEGFWYFRPTMCQDKKRREMALARFNVRTLSYELWLPHRGAVGSWNTFSKIQIGRDGVLNERNNWYKIQFMTDEDLQREQQRSRGLMGRVLGTNRGPHKMTKEDVRKAWMNHYEEALFKCTHLQRGLKCNNGACSEGARLRNISMLHGAFLECWSVISGVLADKNSSDDPLKFVFSGGTTSGYGDKGGVQKMKLVRCQISDEIDWEDVSSLVGVQVESKAVKDLSYVLEAMGGKGKKEALKLQNLNGENQQEIGKLMLQNKKNDDEDSDDSVEIIENVPSPSRNGKDNKSKSNENLEPPLKKRKIEKATEENVLNAFVKYFETLYDEHKESDVEWTHWLEAHRDIGQKFPYVHSPTGLALLKKTLDDLMKSGAITKLIIHGRCVGMQCELHLLQQYERTQRLARENRVINSTGLPAGLPAEDDDESSSEEGYDSEEEKARINAANKKRPAGGSGTNASRSQGGAGAAVAANKRGPGNPQAGGASSSSSGAAASSSSSAAGHSGAAASGTSSSGSRVNNKLSFNPARNNGQHQNDLVPDDEDPVFGSAAVDSQYNVEEPKVMKDLTIGNTDSQSNVLQYDKVQFPSRRRQAQVAPNPIVPGAGTAGDTTTTSGANQFAFPQQQLNNMNNQSQFASSFLQRPNLQPKRPDPAATLRIQKNYLDLIKKGKKTVEGRIKDYRVKFVKKGSTLRFECGQELYDVEVIERQEFPSFASYLTSMGLQKCLPGCSSLSEGIKIYHSFPNFESKAITHGVVAFVVKRFDENVNQVFSAGSLNSTANNPLSHLVAQKNSSSSSSSFLQMNKNTNSFLNQQQQLKQDTAVESQDPSVMILEDEDSDDLLILGEKDGESIANQLGTFNKAKSKENVNVAASTTKQAGEPAVEQVQVEVVPQDQNFYVEKKVEPPPKELVKNQVEQTGEDQFGHQTPLTSDEKEEIIAEVAHSVRNQYKGYPDTTAEHFLKLKLKALGVAEDEIKRVVEEKIHGQGGPQQLHQKSTGVESAGSALGNKFASNDRWLTADLKPINNDDIIQEPEPHCSVKDDIISGRGGFVKRKRKMSEIEKDIDLLLRQGRDLPDNLMQELEEAGAREGVLDRRDNDVGTTTTFNNNSSSSSSGVISAAAGAGAAPDFLRSGGEAAAAPNLLHPPNLDSESQQVREAMSEAAKTEEIERIFAEGREFTTEEMARLFGDETGGGVATAASAAALVPTLASSSALQPANSLFEPQPQASDAPSRLNGGTGGAGAGGAASSSSSSSAKNPNDLNAINEGKKCNSSTVVGGRPALGLLSSTTVAEIRNSKSSSFKSAQSNNSKEQATAAVNKHPAAAAAAENDISSDESESGSSTSDSMMPVKQDDPGEKNDLLDDVEDDIFDFDDDARVFLSASAASATANQQKQKGGATGGSSSSSSSASSSSSTANASNTAATTAGLAHQPSAFSSSSASTLTKHANARRTNFLSTGSIFGGSSIVGPSSSSSIPKLKTSNLFGPTSVTQPPPPAPLSADEQARAKRLRLQRMQSTTNLNGLGKEIHKIGKDVGKHQEDQTNSKNEDHVSADKSGAPEENMISITQDNMKAKSTTSTKSATKIYRKRFEREVLRKIARRRQNEMMHKEKLQEQLSPPPDSDLDSMVTEAVIADTNDVISFLETSLFPSYLEPEVDGEEEVESVDSVGGTGDAAEIQINPYAADAEAELGEEEEDDKEAQELLDVPVVAEEAEPQAGVGEGDARQPVLEKTIDPPPLNIPKPEDVNVSLLDKTATSTKHKDKKNPNKSGAGATSSAAREVGGEQPLPAQTSSFSSHLLAEKNLQANRKKLDALVAGDKSSSSSVRIIQPAADNAIGSAAAGAAAGKTKITTEGSTTTPAVAPVEPAAPTQKRSYKPATFITSMGAKLLSTGKRVLQRTLSGFSPSEGEKDHHGDTVRGAAAAAAPAAEPERKLLVANDDQDDAGAAPEPQQEHQQQKPQPPMQPPVSQGPGPGPQAFLSGMLNTSGNNAQGSSASSQFDFAAGAPGVPAFATGAAFASQTAFGQPAFGATAFGTSTSSQFGSGFGAAPAFGAPASQSAFGASQVEQVQPLQLQPSQHMGSSLPMPPPNSQSQFAAAPPASQSAVPAGFSNYGGATTPFNPSQSAPQMQSNDFQQNFQPMPSQSQAQQQFGSTIGGFGSLSNNSGMNMNFAAGFPSSQIMPPAPSQQLPQGSFAAMVNSQPFPMSQLQPQSSQAMPPQSRGVLTGNIGGGPRTMINPNPYDQLQMQPPQQSQQMQQPMGTTNFMTMQQQLQQQPAMPPPPLPSPNSAIASQNQMGPHGAQPAGFGGGTTANANNFAATNTFSTAGFGSAFNNSTAASSSNFPSGGFAKLVEATTTSVTNKNPQNTTASSAPDINILDDPGGPIFPDGNIDPRTKIPPQNEPNKLQRMKIDSCMKGMKKAVTSNSFDKEETRKNLFQAKLKTYIDAGFVRLSHLLTRDPKSGRTLFQEIVVRGRLDFYQELKKVIPADIFQAVHEDRTNSSLHCLYLCLLAFNVENTNNDHEKEQNIVKMFQELSYQLEHKVFFTEGIDVTREKELLELGDDLPNSGRTTGGGGASGATSSSSSSSSGTTTTGIGNYSITTSSLHRNLDSLRGKKITVPELMEHKMEKGDIGFIEANWLRDVMKKRVGKLAGSREASKVATGEGGGGNDENNGGGYNNNNNPNGGPPGGGMNNFYTTSGFGVATGDTQLVM
ncbi:unnamed protein product [Amoebophrya sp. A120]|nr:unnamed protein product [Amoebophrya sp. A120]|eukprot:GSA120T00019354001.1